MPRTRSAISSAGCVFGKIIDPETGKCHKTGTPEAKAALEKYASGMKANKKFLPKRKSPVRKAAKKSPKKSLKKKAPAKKKSPKKSAKSPAPRKRKSVKRAPVKKPRRGWTTNPETGRHIKINGPTHKKLIAAGVMGVGRKGAGRKKWSPAPVTSPKPVKRSFGRRRFKSDPELEKEVEEMSPEQQRTKVMRILNKLPNKETREKVLKHFFDDDAALLIPEGDDLTSFEDEVNPIMLD